VFFSAGRELAARTSSDPTSSGHLLQLRGEGERCTDRIDR
jgi:hypothetical protein